MTQLEVGDRQNRRAWSFLVSAAARVPGGQWIFAPVALGAAGAIVLGLFLGSARLAFFGTSFAFGFAILFYAFAQGTRGLRKLTGPLVFLTWSVAGLFVLSLVTVYACVFFGWPAKLDWLDAAARPAAAVPLATVSPEVQLATQEMLERIDTSYPKELATAFDLTAVEGEIPAATLKEKLCIGESAPAPGACAGAGDAVCEERSRRLEVCADTRRALHKYLNVFERLGLGVNKGTYDGDAVRQSKRKVVVKVYRAFTGYIELRRKEQKNPRLWDQFETMVRGWESPAANPLAK